MLPLNDYVWFQDYKLNRLPKVIADAEQHRLMQEAGLLRRPWLSCQVCRSLWRLGHLLVDAGQRLEQRFAPVVLRPA